MNFVNALTFLIVIIVFGMVILSSTLVNIKLISTVYGQISQLPSSSPSPSSNVTEGKTAETTKPLPPPASQLLLPSSPISHSIRIISPTKDQQVAIGKDLTVSGISKDNATSDCHVNVIVNNVKPYQNTSATGHGGPNDYSNWTFNLTPKYTTIKQGANNKITAKFFCNPNPNLASFYSVNVTGVSLP